MILLNPKRHERKYPDDASRQVMLKTIEFFESKGRGKVKADDRDRVWYADFLKFQSENKLFAQLLTPAQYGGGNEEYRWDTYRNCEFNEILAFYGLAYWYTWQVSILGLGPIWISKNEKVKQRTAQLLKEGGIFGFGLSEKEHGADIYSTEMMLVPQDDGTYRANGRKYYIGNGNEAALVSTLGKIRKPGEKETDKYERFVFFVVGSKHGRYEVVKNIVNSQSFVAEYALNDYPIYEDDLLAKGRDAWDMALNTVNIGKYNLGWASIGICTHAFYEAIDHASNRVLYGKHVTDFPHVRKLFVDAYCRLVAMKIFALRAADYIRTASPQDRRYLLYTPMVKMKVTTQGEEVIDLLWDVIAAKGFEKDMFFEMAARDIRALPKLEGTVHVNMALIIKFMRNYFFDPGEFPEISRVDAPRSDDFLFNQGPTKGLSDIQFHDFNIAYDSAALPNVGIFKEQIKLFKELLYASAMDPAAESQAEDIDFLLTLGELFTLVAYGQLIIEYRNLEPEQVSEDLLDQIFDFMVRDFSKFSLQLYSKTQSTPKQMAICLKMVKKPVVDQARYGRIWNEHVYALKGQYAMND
ncbi:MAG TPA: acyl-CoA dehydrogenase family protein [Candidatus Brocadiia bacterium]|nr:acyl-CoA dehydrogenase family protein [Candidatus Brocadiia bacterium]